MVLHCARFASIQYSDIILYRGGKIIYMYNTNSKTLCIEMPKLKKIE